MIIYLNKRVLIQSEVFSKDIIWKEREKRDGQDSERDWNLYTWNSEGKLSFEEDNITGVDRNVIEATLEKYEGHPKRIHDEFIANGISMPDYFIHISGCNSLINTPKKTMIKIIKNLEKENINCLLNDCTVPTMSHIFYTSPKLKKQLANPIEVEL